MTTKKEQKVRIIDANGKSLGRVASNAARELIGKKSVKYDPAKFMPTDIKIINIGLIKFTGRNKMKDKQYKRFSGYPSGLKIKSLEQELKKSPSRVVTKAIWGMLPKNKLRKRFIKHVSFSV